MKKELLIKSKKVLAYYTLITSLGLASLTACDNNKGFEYQIEENGDINAIGKISFNEVKKLQLVHLTNNIAEYDKYHLASYNEIYQKYNTADYIVYYDVETDRTIYSTNSDDYKNFEIEIIVAHMIDYLYKYDMVKDEYSIEDIKKLKQYLTEDETLIKNNKNNQKSLKK